MTTTSTWQAPPAPPLDRTQAVAGAARLADRRDEVDAGRHLDVHEHVGVAEAPGQHVVEAARVPRGVVAAVGDEDPLAHVASPACRASSWCAIFRRLNQAWLRRLPRSYQSIWSSRRAQATEPTGSGPSRRFSAAAVSPRCPVAALTGVVYSYPAGRVKDGTPVRTNVTGDTVD